MQKSLCKRRHMCGQCRAEFKLALSSTKSGRKRARQELETVAPSPTLKLIQITDGNWAFEAPAQVVLNVCSTTSLGDDSTLHIPLSSAALGKFFVDFCQRVSNVRGRSMSMQIAWRKSLWPRLITEHDGLRSAVELLAAARAIGCAMLSEQCCAVLAEHIQQRRYDAIVHALALVMCADLRGALLGDVFESMIKSGDEAALREAADAQSEATTSPPSWLSDAARGALIAARERRRLAQESERQHVDLGIGVDIEGELKTAIGDANVRS